MIGIISPCWNQISRFRTIFTHIVRTIGVHNGVNIYQKLYFLYRYDTLLLTTLSIVFNSEFMEIEPVINNRVSYLLKNTYFLIIFRCFMVKFWK